MLLHANVVQCLYDNAWQEVKFVNTERSFTYEGGKQSWSYWTSLI